MKYISQKQLKQMKKKYETDPSNVTLSNIIVFNPLKKLNNVSQNLKFNPVYDIKIKPRVEVDDQGRTGRCWMFAAFNILRPKICKKYNLENFEFSSNFLFFWDKFEKCNTFLEIMILLKDEPIDSRKMSFFLSEGLSDGGQWNYFVNLVSKYGLIPKSSFNESFHSCKSEDLNDVLFLKLKNFTKKIRSSSNPQKYQMEFMTEIYRILCLFLGVPPTRINFEFEDKKKKHYIFKNLSPTQFYKKHVHTDLTDYIILVNDSRKRHPYYKMYQQVYGTNIWKDEKFTFLNIPMKRMKEIALKSLKNNEPVWFGGDSKKFLNENLSSFNENALGDASLLNLSLELTKEERIEYLSTSITHAMVLTGVKTTKNGVTDWQLQNSWGKNGPQDGYYNMSDNWFDEYGFEIIVLKKFLNKKELNILKTKPILIEDPWDQVAKLKM